MTQYDDDSEKCVEKNIKIIKKKCFFQKFKKCGNIKVYDQSTSLVPISEVVSASMKKIAEIKDLFF